MVRLCTGHVRNQAKTTHVDAFVGHNADAGSIPAASTIYSAGLHGRLRRVEYDSIVRKEGSFVMSESLEEIAKRIEARPWNRSGTDKTWVLNAMSTHLQFREEVRKATRVRDR